MATWMANFADNIFKYIVWIMIIISLQCVPKGLISNNTALVQQFGTKPNLVAKILAMNFGDHLCIGYQIW